MEAQTIQAYPPLKSSIESHDWIALCLGTITQEGLDRVVKVLCPWPCVRVTPNYWFTRDGSLIANCQWNLYKDEAITPTQASELMKVSYAAIYKMIKAGKLTAYRLPDEKLVYDKNGVARRPWYLRRSEVERWQR